MTKPTMELMKQGDLYEYENSKRVYEFIAGGTTKDCNGDDYIWSIVRVGDKTQSTIIDFNAITSWKRKNNDEFVELLEATND